MIGNMQINETAKPSYAKNFCGHNPRNMALVIAITRPPIGNNSRK
jgi:hypothetical protein